MSSGGPTDQCGQQDSWIAGLLRTVEDAGAQIWATAELDDETNVRIPAGALRVAATVASNYNPWTNEYDIVEAAEGWELFCTFDAAESSGRLANLVGRCPPVAGVDKRGAAALMLHALWDDGRRSYSDDRPQSIYAGDLLSKDEIEAVCCAVWPPLAKRERPKAPRPQAQVSSPPAVAEVPDADPGPEGLDPAMTAEEARRLVQGVRERWADLERRGLLPRAIADRFPEERRAAATRNLPSEGA